MGFDIVWSIKFADKKSDKLDVVKDIFKELSPKPLTESTEYKKYQGYGAIRHK